MPVMVDSEGKYVSFTPTVPVAAGAIVALGELVGIAPVAIASGSVGQVAVRGIVRVPKPVSGGIAAGTKLWWDILAETFERFIDTRFDRDAMRCAVNVFQSRL
jgi:predicted RecA/RadA family phage recombinase